MRVTAIQLEIRDRSKAATRAHVQQLLERARGSDLILLPEIWPVGYFSFSRYRSEAESGAGSTVQFLKAQARALKATLFAGSFVERRGNRYSNTSLLIDAKGSVRARYRRFIFSATSQMSVAYSPLAAGSA